jgi:hypothetical protein
MSLPHRGLRDVLLKCECNGQLPIRLSSTIAHLNNVDDTAAVYGLKELPHAVGKSG